MFSIKTQLSLSLHFLTLRETICPFFSDTNDQLLAFNQLCLPNLDIVAPLITKQKTTTKIAPWMNKDIRGLRITCRKAECRWKSSKLQVHYLLLKDLLTAYNGKIKETRDQYFAQLISTNQHNPRILFNTINQLVNSPPPIADVSSSADCDKILSFFIEKIDKIRANITPPTSAVDLTCPSLLVMDCFRPISLQDLKNTVALNESFFKSS